jgi:hypothetical protein
MFAKDVHLLNEIYSQKINEMNLGPLGDQDSGAGLSTDKIQQITGLNKRPCLKKCCRNAENNECPDEDCEDGMCGCQGEANHEETNTDMVKQSLYRLVKLAAMLHDLVCKNNNAEPWILSKVTEALNHIESVYGYADYENYKHQVDSDISVIPSIDEETEADLYSSIQSGGGNIISQIKQVLSKESKENLEKLLYETISVLENKKLNF